MLFPPSLHLLHSASFWESPIYRSECVQILKERIVPDREDVISTFTLLLYFPLEYFSVQLLASFVRCALQVEVRTKNSQDLAVLRTFVKRVFVYTDFGDKNEIDLFKRLLKPVEIDPSNKELYMTASLDLAQVYLTRIFKSSKKSKDSEPVLRLLKLFKPSSFFKNHLSSECFIRMVDVFDRDAGFGLEDTTQIFNSLRDEFAQRLINIEDQQHSLSDCARLVRVWDAFIRLGKWIPGDDNRHFLADRLMKGLIPRTTDVLEEGMEEFGVATFSVLVGEVQDLTVLLAVYLSLANKLSESGLKEMDNRLGRTVKALGVPDFENLLTSITESLSCKSPRLEELVHLGSLLIHNHPFHSQPVVQKFMSKCLGLFNHDPIFVEGDPKLRLRVLEMIAQYCTDQQTALGAQNTSLIWLFTSKLLAPSKIHDKDTNTEIFHKILSIIVTLVRSRRDLVILGLSHLGLILQRLIRCLRACRPDLGPKQLSMVMDTLPRWISNTGELRGEEARALSRALESLTVKTVPSFQRRQHEGVKKSESLAKPFSKHAAYVLKAYVEGLNDGLCVMSLEVRQGLREGLFVLCEVMGVYNRDALMVGGGLDGAGKAVLKMVWKDWEGVRYVGKG